MMSQLQDQLINDKIQYTKTYDAALQNFQLFCHFVNTEHEFQLKPISTYTSRL